MTQPIDIRRPDPTPNPHSSFVPGRPKEAPKPTVRPTLLPAKDQLATALAKAALTKEIQKEQKNLLERFKQLDHEDEFAETGALFVFDEEEEKPKPETSK